MKECQDICSGTCCSGCFHDCFKNTPKNLYKNFTGAVVASFIIKTIGVAISLIFTAADLVQFLGWLDKDLPESGLNNFLEALGDDVGDYKWLAILASIACNVIFNDQLIEKLLDKGKSAWGIVGLEFLYFIVENIDNYAALCFGNLSHDLLNANPLFALIVALMFGQLYGSDLWVVGKNVTLLGFCVI